MRIAISVLIPIMAGCGLGLNQPDKPAAVQALTPDAFAWRVRVEEDGSFGSHTFGANWKINTTQTNQETNQ